MYSKTKIFNLALNALLLQRQVIDADTDRSNEAARLRSVWEVALNSALAEMKLAETKIAADLELIEDDPNDLWNYVYRYPSHCATFLRIQSCVVRDRRSTHIRRQIGHYEGEKAIFTNEAQAIGEYITNDIELPQLSVYAGMAIAMSLASHASSLIVGKGAANLKRSINEEYLKYVALAQAQDARENEEMTADVEESSWAAARVGEDF